MILVKRIFYWRAKMGVADCMFRVFKFVEANNTNIFAVRQNLSFVG